MGFDLFLPGKGQKEILNILLILSKNVVIEIESIP
jgi:hypothetical protein